MIRLLFPILCILFLPVMTGCEHRPLVEMNHGRYIRVYIDEQIKNVTYGFYDESKEKPEYTRPSVLRVVFADTDTGELVAERYLQNNGSDELGYYIDGHIALAEGRYNMLVYSFGSAVTLIRNERNYYQMQAYTSPISERYYSYMPQTRQELDEAQIVYEPEHLFHAVAEPMEVGITAQTDTLRTAGGEWFKAHSMVLSYYLQVRVKGVEWVTSAVSLLSGMAGSSVLHGHHQMVETDPVHLFFGMSRTDIKRSGGSSTAMLYTTFNTFGKLPEQASVYTLNFEFMKKDGSSQVEKIEITPLFDTPEVRDNQWILLEHEIEITPPEGATAGGMTPGVDEWEDVETNVEL